MMTILVFNEEDKVELTCAQKGKAAHFALMDMDALLRKTAKYGALAEADAADVWRKTLHECMEAHGVSLEDIP